jgi:ribosomal protein S3
MFLIFSQILFSSFISKTTTLAEGKQILGVKFLINGRLKGKPRSNATTLLVGSVPVQSLEKDIQFSKLHVNTIYGVFGFQIWVYRK